MNCVPFNCCKKICIYHIWKLFNRLINVQKTQNQYYIQTLVTCKFISAFNNKIIYLYLYIIRHFLLFYSERFRILLVLPSMCSIIFPVSSLLVKGKKYLINCIFFFVSLKHFRGVLLWVQVIPMWKRRV